VPDGLTRLIVFTTMTRPSTPCKGVDSVTLMTEVRRSEPGVSGSGRKGRGGGHGAWFLVLPALIPILVLSVGPLL
jgi:multiple sugar transport system permease protein